MTSCGLLSSVCVCVALILCLHKAAHAEVQTDAVDAELPPIRTEIKYADEKEEKNDDPNKAWEEWGETAETRRNPFPRRQRSIEVGMDINAIMGMAMRQPKVVSAVLTEQFGASERIGQMVTRKFHDQMAAAGIGCRLWFVLKGRQVIANCETIRDGHMCKEYMIRQPEIMRTVLDNVPFTPKPTPADDDDDDDDEDDDEDDAKTAKDVSSSKVSEGSSVSDGDVQNGSEADSKVEL